MKNLLSILTAIILVISCTDAQTNKDLRVNHKVNKPQEYNDSIVSLAKSGYTKYKENLSTRKVIIVDFNKPMEEDRLFIVDLDSNKIIKSTKVCHGMGSDGSGRTSIPTAFSNVNDSKKSSLGFMKTAETYKGSFGYSMRVDGLEKRNNRVRDRSIVFHNSEVQRTPWSWGCFSIPKEDYKEVIDLTKNGSLIYSFSNANETK